MAGNNPIAGMLKTLAVDSIVMAVLTIIIALGFICGPTFFGDMIVIFAGWMFIIMGIVAIVGFCVYGRFMSGYSLMTGVLFALCGAFCLIRPDVVEGLITVMIGIFIIIDAATSLSTGIECVRFQIPGGIIMAVLSALCLVLGIIIMFGPFETIMAILGWALLFDGCMDLVLCIFFSRRAHEVKEQAEQRRREMRRRDMIDLGEQ